MSVGNPNMASLFYLKAWVVSVSHIKYILLFSNHLQLELLIGPGAWKNSELPRYDEVLTTVPGYISAISGSSFIRCSILLFPPVISSQSSKQRWRKIKSKIQFPHHSALFNFSVDNYAKIRAKRGLDQWEGSLPVQCWWKLPSKPKEEGYVLVGLLSRLHILKDSDFRTTISFSLLSWGWHHHYNHWPSLGG